MAFYGDEKHNLNPEWNEQIDNEEHYTVDVPPSEPDKHGNFHEWKNVNFFATKQEALDFAREHFGADENGMVCLISSF